MARPIPLPESVPLKHQIYACKDTAAPSRTESEPEGNNDNAANTAAETELDAAEKAHGEEWVEVTHEGIEREKQADERAELRRKIGIDRERAGDFVVL
ncbi:hypothetical protein LTR85_001153 [Meristemomyces frigidus]|nr:hypothetical protein LTR85_001153 [Meristemomyces frigidus]